MNRWKRWFITPYLTSLVVGLSLGVGAAIFRGWEWLGLVPLTLPIAVVTVVHTLAPRRARTSRRYPSFVVAGVAGWLVSWWGWPNPWPVVVASGYLAGMFLYLNWYSEYSVPRSRFLTPGQRIPNFSALEQGRPVGVEDLRGNPALLLFYRGNWCPVCTAQIDELAKAYDGLRERNIAVVLVSPQKDEHTRAVARRVGLPFRFWVDEDNAAAQALKIVDPAGLPLGMELLDYGSETPIPTAILLDDKGVILYSDQAENYRIRPEPAEYLAAFDRHQAASPVATNM